MVGIGKRNGFYIDMYKYLIFNHIPKCAGTSFRKMFFDSCYEPSSFFYKKPIYISTLTHNNITLDSTKIENIQNILHKDTCLFIDHSKYNNIETVFNLRHEECYRITCIRDPVERILSHNDFFTKIPINVLINDEKQLNRLINTCGKLMMWYVVDAMVDKKNLMDPYDFAYDTYKHKYNFIFKLENLQKDIEIFNHINPFNINLINQKYNTNNKKQNCPKELVQKIKHKIPQEILLYKKLGNND